MIERTIKLILDEYAGHTSYRQIFLITLNDNGAEIRRSGCPVVDRDTSVSISVGREPDFTEIGLRVEEA